MCSLLRSAKLDSYLNSFGKRYTYLKVLKLIFSIFDFISLLIFQCNFHTQFTTYDFHLTIHNRKNSKIQQQQKNILNIYQK